MVHSCFSQQKITPTIPVKVILACLFVVIVTVRSISKISNALSYTNCQTNYLVLSVYKTGVIEHLSNGYTFYNLQINKLTFPIKSINLMSKSAHGAGIIMSA
jgi:hypothetical protein